MIPCVFLQVKRLRERLKQASRREESVLCNYSRPQVKQSDVFLTQLNALTSPRNIRTRRLAQAEDNPELTRTARLAYVLRDLYNVVIAAKGMLQFSLFVRCRVACIHLEYMSFQAQRK
jgi:histone-lysine N-methyltransferase ASH1L